MISKDETEIKLKYVEKAVDELKVGCRRLSGFLILFITSVRPAIFITQGQVKIVVDNSNHNTDQMTFMTLELDK